ncbi:MAG: aminoglycoside phosphotransferase family protein [Rubrivivax sp.]|nr:aminoglycoside phosphotransferase family protein [Rubrivivax sp.]
MTTLPQGLGPAAFDDLHDRPAASREAIESLARELGPWAERDPLAIRQQTEGTALVAFLGDDRVLKLYPPFLADHCAFERAVLERLHGRLAVPTPRLLAGGEREGWPFTVMTQLHGGVLLSRLWPAMAEAARLKLLRSLGELTVQVHGLPVDDALLALAPPWDPFIAGQRRRCLARQQRTGLPAHLLGQVEAFVAAGPVPAGAPVLLTGEYTPMNLFARPTGELAAMFDFGDGLVGPRAYDWLGPLAFLAAGSAARVAAFMGGVGVPLTAALREQLLRLLLLHRYSHLPLQLQSCPGWEQAGSFAELAERLWPLQ